MNITLSDIIVWLVVGALAGSFAGMLVTRQKGGFGVARNVGVGLVGALVGGALFRLLKIDLPLADITISAEDLVSAVVGSLILVGVMALVRSRRGRKKSKSRQ